MFKCDTCNENSQSGIKPAFRVVQTRAKEYPERGMYNEFGDWMITDRGGQGFETVKEIKECPHCSLVANSQNV